MAPAKAFFESAKSVVGWKPKQVITDGHTEVLATHKDLADRMQELEATQRGHSSLIVAVAKEIRKLKQGPRHKKPRIGF
jgi:hypothetical protein